MRTVICTFLPYNVLDAQLARAINTAMSLDGSCIARPFTFIERRIYGRAMCVLVFFFLIRGNLFHCLIIDDCVSVCLHCAPCILS